MAHAYNNSTRVVSNRWEVTTISRNYMPSIAVNLGCLHPVARVRSDDVGFYPSTQRHYRRLIYYLYISPNGPVAGRIISSSGQPRDSRI
jgi:hypothetical protein